MLLDIGFVLFLGYGLYLGFSKGVLRAVIYLATVLIAIVLALKISPIVYHAISDLLQFKNLLLLVVCFILVYMLAIFGLKWISSLFDKLLKPTSIGFINKLIAGIILGLFFLFCFGILARFLDSAGLISEQAKEKSYTWEVLETIPGHGKSALEKARPFFEEFWNATEEQ